MDSSKNAGVDGIDCWGGNEGLKNSKLLRRPQVKSNAEATKRIDCAVLYAAWQNSSKKISKEAIVHIGLGQ